MYHLTTDWISGLQFSSEIEGINLIMDSAALGLNKGPSPKRLMLLSLMGCTGMDVISLLEKMRVPVEAFRIEATAPLTAEHPKVFTEVRLKYILHGKGIKSAKVEKAVELSQTRYCGVSIMLKKHCPVTYEVEISES